MSNVCIFNIVDEINNYDKLNNIVKKLVQTALNADLGIAFNSEYYDLTESSTFKNYFLLSDSFIYRHSDELLNPNGLWDDGCIDSFKEKFIRRFKFFQILINELFNLQIKKVEIYFVDTNDPIGTLKDFKAVQTDGSDFVSDLLSIVLEAMDKWGGTIPTSLKFEVIKANK